MRRLLFPIPILLAGAVLAAGLDNSAGRFDERVMRRDRSVIAVAPRSIDRLDAGDKLRSGWEAFRLEQGGNWNIYFDERTGAPTMVSGSGIQWFGPEEAAGMDLAGLEEKARRFLKRFSLLLGNFESALVLDTDASRKLRTDYWQLVFRLQVDDVEVENARFDFHVQKGRLTLFGASNWSLPNVGGIPSIDSADARVLLGAYLGEDLAVYEDAAEPELLLTPLDPAPWNGVDRPRAWNGPRGKGLTHALVWRLEYRDPEGPEIWVGEVDAHDGAIRAFYDGAHYASVEGGVFPENSFTSCETGGCELDQFPMPFADWTENGQSAAVADAYGNFDCTDPAATFQTSLIGPYVRIDDSCGPISETASCDGAVQLDLKRNENCDVGPHTSPGNTAAARSSFYHLNRAIEAARFYMPTLSWLDSQITVTSNWPNTCNASYGGGNIYVYQSGGYCANTGEIQGIVVHEWGHGLDDNDGGGWDNTSEAYGDVVAMFASRTSCFGHGFYTDGWLCSGYGDTCLPCTGFRGLDWAARTANTPATPQVFVADNCGTGSGPCGGEVHCEAYPIGEAMYDLATRDLVAAGLTGDTAWQLAERLWYTTRQGSGGDIYTCALPASDSCAAGSWYQRLRGADDDDGNLANGTPHAAALYAAFARHNIACGLPADPENQNSSACSSLAADQSPYPIPRSWLLKLNFRSRTRCETHTSATSTSIRATPSTPSFSARRLMRTTPTSSPRARRFPIQRASN